MILHPEGRQEENSPSSGVRCPWGHKRMQEKDRRACSDIDASTLWWAGGPCLVLQFASPQATGITGLHEAQAQGGQGRTLPPHVSLAQGKKSI